MTSLFNELQWDLIEKPQFTKSYRKVIAKNRESKEEKEKIEKEEWLELCKEKKKELWEEDFRKWWQKEYYQRNREKCKERELERYYRRKKDEEIMLDEIYKEVYDPIPYPINYNKFYAEKYKDDDTDSAWWFKFYRRASRLNRVHANLCDAITTPIRVYNRWWFGIMFSKLGKMQDRAYEYINPHLSEITIKDMFLAQEQFFTKLPMWITKWKMRELTEATDISKNQVCSVASALLRWKYIRSELYLWRVSFLIWDVIISQSWNIFRPILENNLPRLTKDTVEELHQKRFDWLYRRIDDLPIYVIRDAYLIKIPINEREILYYIVPT